MMGTRCGDVDPAALLYIQEKEHLDNDGMQKLINKQSGLTGISGISSDMRDIDAAIAAGNERARRLSTCTDTASLNMLVHTQRRLAVST